MCEELSSDTLHCPYRVLAHLVPPLRMKEPSIGEREIEKFSKDRFPAKVSEFESRREEAVAPHRLSLEFGTSGPH